jgi:hypothetical protein
MADPAEIRSDLRNLVQGPEGTENRIWSARATWRLWLPNLRKRKRGQI